jgi:hypothetical protein
MSMLRTILADVSGASFVALDTITVPTLKGGKKNPHQGHVRKVMIGTSVMIFAMKNGGSAYENMVNRRLIAEGKDPSSFSLGPRKWGVRVEGTPFIEHNGQQYLEVIFLRPGKAVYELNGEVVDPGTIEGLELEKDEAEQGGLENKVIIRTFKVDSIAAITVNKQQYNLQ